MNKKWFKVIGIVIVIALVGVAILAAVASAQETTQGFSVFGQQFNGGPGFGRGGHGGRGGPGGFGGPRGERPPKIDGMREAVEAATAEALGMTVEELEAAHQSGQRLPDIAAAQGVEMADVQAAAQAAAQEVIEAAVADGTLTQEQADMMLQHKGGFGGPGRMGPPPQLEGLKEATEAAVAETLGMTVEELQAAHEAGQTMPEIAKEKDVHMADIQAAAETAKQAFIEQAVADGTITQEQADFMLAHRGGPGGPGGPGGGCGGGRHGGPHGGPGGGFGFGPGGSQFNGEAPASSLDNL